MKKNLFIPNPPPSWQRQLAQAIEREKEERKEEMEVKIIEDLERKKLTRRNQEESSWRMYRETSV